MIGIMIKKLAIWDKPTWFPTKFQYGAVLSLVAPDWSEKGMGDAESMRLATHVQRWGLFKEHVHSFKIMHYPN